MNNPSRSFGRATVDAPTTRQPHCPQSGQGNPPSSTATRQKSRQADDGHHGKIDWDTTSQCTGHIRAFPVVRTYILPSADRWIAVNQPHEVELAPIPGLCEEDANSKKTPISPENETHSQKALRGNPRIQIIPPADLFPLSSPPTVT